MSKSKKPIDDLFNKGLQNFEVTPDPALWSEISKKLPQKKKKQRIIPMWFWPAGIAASLALFFVLKSFDDTSIVTPELVSQEAIEEICPEDVITEITTLVIEEKESPVQIKSENETSSADNINLNLKKENPQNTVAIVSPKKQSKQQKEIKLRKITEVENKNFKDEESLANVQKIKTKKNQEASKRTTPEEKPLVAIIIEDQQNEKQTPSIKKEKVVSEILGEKPEEEEKLALNKPSKKWSIQPQIAPLVYNSISGNSTLEANFQNQVASTETGLSYGIKIAYQAAPKLHIRSGISTANIDVFTNQVSNRSLFAGEIPSIQLNTPPSDEVVNPDPDPSISPPMPIGILDSPIGTPTDPTNGGNRNPTNDSNSEGVLQQQINYIEIPLELTYRVVNKRFGTSLIGGISTFILSQNNNEIFFNQAENSSLIGTSNNLNTTSFSGNFGIGLDYKITKDIRVSVEPTVKFQFNAFDSSTDFNPYIFGVYSGIKFNL